MDKKLENMLHANKVPAPSAQLVYRITECARSIPQKISLWKVMGSLCKEFRLPEPAIGLVSLLITSFIIGFTSYNAASASTVNDTIIEQFFNETEDLL